MFEILLLLAAAFSGHEVAANVDATPQAAATPQSVVETAADHQVPVAANLAAEKPVVHVADETAVHVAQDTSDRAADAADNDAGITAAVNRIADFYDTTPPSPPAARKRAKPAAATSVDDTPPARPALGPHLVSRRDKYESEGIPVVIEVLRPDDDERRPAVLILHGASGIGDGAFYRGAAEIFAERGYVTFLPHYLDAARAVRPKIATKHAKAPAKRAGGKLPQDGSIRAGFPRQEQILRDAVDYIAANPYVNPTRIGVFGLSLGGFHALTLSSRDGRIAAVVDMSGALRGNVAPESNHLAPTLELHGAHDPIVPVARARALASTLERLGVPHEVKIYPNQGHFLRGKAQEDAMERAAAFFGTYLTPAETSHTAQSSSTADYPY